VPPENRQAWRLHHVEAGDTLETIAKTYHLPAERISAVNRAADSLETGDVLLIPAVYHEERPPARRWRNARGKVVQTGGVKSNKGTAAGHSTRIAAGRRLPAQVLHRKAAVRTARLEQ
jgi:hypothetical protein